MAFKLPSAKDFNYKLNHMDKSQFVKRYLSFVRNVKLHELNQMLDQIHDLKAHYILKTKTTENNKFTSSKSTFTKSKESLSNVDKLNLLLLNNKPSLNSTVSSISSSPRNVVSQSIQSKKAA